MGRAQGADDVDPGRVAFVADAGANGLEGVGAGQVAFDQVGQLQVFEHELQEFLLGNLEHKLVHAFAGIARLAWAFTAATALGALDMFAGGELLVARVHDGLFAAATVVQHRFVNVASGNTDLLAMLHVGDGAAADGLFNGLFDVVTVTPQETLAVYRALVLAIEASVDHIAHGEPSGQLHVTSFKPRAGSLETSGQLPGQRPGSTRLSLPYCDLRTRRYHSESSRTCLSV